MIITAARPRRYSGNDEFRPNPATGGVALCATALPSVISTEANRSGETSDYSARLDRTIETKSETEYSGWPYSATPARSESCVVVSETEARRLVTAIDNCRPSDVIAVIKRQPWFEEIRRGVRATRHLAPDTYLHLSGHVRASNRPREMARSSSRPSSNLQSS